LIKVASIVSETKSQSEIERRGSIASSTRSLMNKLRQDDSVPFFPKHIESHIEYKEAFSKQFGDIIGKKLKKKLDKVQNLEQK